jgi:serine/threonine protein kinase
VKVSLSRAGAPPFEVELGKVVFEGPQSVLQDASTRASGPGLPDDVVVKRGKRRGDYGRLELEQLACERLEHPGLARYFGSARTPELGTVLAFERLGQNPLLLLNEHDLRPAWRDPHTFRYPLPPGRALELAFDALVAIEYVHSRGFVHGGVTLPNLRVRVPGPTDDPVAVLERVAEGCFEGTLAGLGGARALSFLESLRTGQTDPELTPMPDRVHAAPEALMERVELGGRLVFAPPMDVYAWGLVFYQLVTGHQPYGRFVKQSELASTQVLHELKLKETRGEVSPIWLDALDEIPLHDTAFASDPARAWPDFHNAVTHLLRRTTHPDPRERMDANTARQFFEEELRMRPSLSSAPRPWTQKTFQMRPSANRLLGDRPGLGISIREEEGQLVVVERRAPPKARLALEKSLPAGEGTLVTFRPEDHSARTAVRSREGVLGATVRELVPLKDILVAYRAKKPLPISPPCLLTTLGLGPRDLARCSVYSLGRAAARVKITGTELEEEVRVTIGRADENDVVLPDSSISKKHAILEKRAGRWYVEDLGSANGTFVDGKKLTPKTRVALRGKLVRMLIGPSFELAYVEESEMRAYLDRALEVIKQILGTKPAPAVPEASAAPDTSGISFLDEAPSSSVNVKPRTPEVPFPAKADAPTTKFRRDLVQKKAGGAPIEFPLARRDPPKATPAPGSPLANLGARLALSKIEGLVRLHAAPGASFVTWLDGDRSERCDNPDDVLALARPNANAVVAVDLELPGQAKRQIYRRD